MTKSRSPSQLQRDQERAEWYQMIRELRELKGQLDTVDQDVLEELVSDLDIVLANSDLSREDFVLFEEIYEEILSLR